MSKPGVYELPYGTSMKRVIYELCGGIKGAKNLKAIIPGGSSVQILRADEIEAITLDYECLKAHGSALGTGGMIVLDESVSIPEAMKNLFAFYHHESCGQCTPCREGTAGSIALAKILAGEGSKEDYQTILDVLYDER